LLRRHLHLLRRRLLDVLVLGTEHCSSFLHLFHHVAFIQEALLQLVHFQINQHPSDLRSILLIDPANKWIDHLSHDIPLLFSVKWGEVIPSPKKLLDCWLLDRLRLGWLLHHLVLRIHWRSLILHHLWRIRLSLHLLVLVQLISSIILLVISIIVLIGVLSLSVSLFFSVSVIEITTSVASPVKVLRA
jgi:hypothetical protein